MSESIENLLVRNLDGVFGERDLATRTTAIAAIFATVSSLIHAAAASGIAGWKTRLSLSRRSSRTTSFRRSAASTPCRTADGSPGRSARRTNRAGSQDWTLPS